MRFLTVPALAALACLAVVPVAAAQPSSSETPATPSTPSTSSTTSSSEPSPAPQPGVWLVLSPASGASGTSVHAQLACATKAGSLVSEALAQQGTFARNPEGHQPWALFGTAVVRDVPPGTYPVTVDCGGRRASAEFTVLGGKPTSGPTRGAQVQVVPRGPAQTGGGGTAG